MGGWWNGRHTGLKILWSQDREGSSPSPPTIIKNPVLFLGVKNMNEKNNEYLPSLERVLKKVFICFIIMMMFVPPILTSCFAATEVETTQQEIFVNEIINNHIQEIKDKGYTDVRYIVSPLSQIEGHNYISNNYETNIEKLVLKEYVFSVKYFVVSNKKNTIYFKTEKEKKDFIKQITKYQKNDYVEKIMWKQIGIETEQKQVNNIINKAKQDYIARQKQKIKKKTTNKVIYTSGNIDTSNAIVRYAIQFNGNPYVSGGTSLTRGADCSGFTQSIYKHFGVSIPRTPAAQAKVGKKVSFNELKSGDLVFYSGNGGKSVTHVALYIGGGKIIHASTPKGGIKISTVNIMIKMTARRVI